MVPLGKVDKNVAAASSQCVIQISVEYAEYTTIPALDKKKKAVYDFGDDDDEVQGI